MLVSLPSLAYTVLKEPAVTYGYSATPSVHRHQQRGVLINYRPCKYRRRIVAVHMSDGSQLGFAFGTREPAGFLACSLQGNADGAFRAADAIAQIGAVWTARICSIVVKGEDVGRARFPGGAAPAVAWAAGCVGTCAT